MRVVALMSTFCEGSLAISAMQSAMMLDGILVVDGPVEGNQPDPDRITQFPVNREKIVTRFGKFSDDAEKRTYMVSEAKRLWPGELWALMLDGDELLLWGEYLRDWIERVRTEGDEGDPIAAWPFPLVELDGSVTICAGKLLRIDFVRRYLASSSYVEFMNGGRKTMGNVMYWSPTTGPMVENWRARPVLNGEPHLLHRPLLRSKGRAVERQHVAEERAYRGLILP